MKLIRLATILLPTINVWLITAIFLLLYIFELLYEVFPSDSFSIGILLLFITASFATIALYFTGYFIDKKPSLLKPLINISLFMSSLALFLIVLGINNIKIFFLTGLPLLGINLGILATSAGVLYTSHSNIAKRGITYAIVIVFSAVFSLFPVPILNTLKLDYSAHLIFLGSFSMISAIIFYFISHSIEPWKNDPFPTPFTRIINRQPVKAYLSAHFFIYLMIGFAFATISQLGEINYSNVLIEVFYGIEFYIDQNKLFWLLVFFGDLTLIIPMGWLSDKIGRKKLIIIGCYGIILAALIVGLGKDELSYYLSAFLLGACFAAMHPSIDSAVWADLSPLDSLGRYNALGFIFLLQGLSFGLAIGLFTPQMIDHLDNLANISYILIGIAILGLFPLFFVADTYKPLDIYLLLVSISGILVFNYDFKFDKEFSNKDLALVTGALSAIGTVFEETIHEDKAVLDLVRHGNIFIIQSKIITNERTLIGTIFANKNDPELFYKLKMFLEFFHDAFRVKLDSWIGQTSIFSSAIEIAEDIFGPLIPSQTFSRSSEK